MTTVENNTFTGPNAGVAGGYVPLTTIESTSMDGDLDLVKDDLDYHLSILQAIYIKLDTIEIGATATPSASAMVSTINTSAELIDADNLESTVALLSNIISDIEAHRVTTIQSAMHPEDSIKSTDQVYSYTPSSIVTSCQNVLDEINNIRIQIHKILGQTTWIDTPNTTLAAIKTKLDTIESGATADQIGSEIKSLYEVEPNAYTNVKDSKLNTIESGATIDQTGSEIKSLYEMESNAYTNTKDTKLNGIETGADLTPSGLISMWHGLIANIPSGWILCNGSNGTPDLCAKFVRGAPNSTEAGATGGEDEHTLTVAEMPAHTHTGRNSTEWTDAGSGHVVGSDASSPTGSTGGDEAHNNMPSYYEILFIMKI